MSTTPRSISGGGREGSSTPPPAMLPLASTDDAENMFGEEAEIVAPPPILPFGEYVRHLLGHPANTILGCLSSRCATLYIYRNDPVLLKKLMTRWFHLLPCGESDTGTCVKCQQPVVFRHQEHHQHHHHSHPQQQEQQQEQRDNSSSSPGSNGRTAADRNGPPSIPVCPRSPKQKGGTSISITCGTGSSSGVVGAGGAGGGGGRAPILAVPSFRDKEGEIGNSEEGSFANRSTLSPIKRQNTGLPLPIPCHPPNNEEAFSEGEEVLSPPFGASASRVGKSTGSSESAPTAIDMSGGSAAAVVGASVSTGSSSAANPTGVPRSPASIMGQDGRKLSSTDFEFTLEEQWTNHMLTVFQNCVERYFSRHWSQQKRVVEANIQYRQFLEDEEKASEFFTVLFASPRTETERLNLEAPIPRGGGPSSSSGPMLTSSALQALAMSMEGSTDDFKTRASSVEFEDTPSEGDLSSSRHLFPKASTSSFVVPSTTVFVTSDGFDEVIQRHKEEGVAVIFHGGFSEPSCELLRTLDRLKQRAAAISNGASANSADAAPVAGGTGTSRSPSGGGASETAAGNSGSDELKVLRNETGAPLPLQQPVPTTKAIATPTTPSPPATLAALVKKLPHIVAVDCAQDWVLFHRYKIRWFPTIMYIDESNETRVYPEQGVIRQPQFLLEWFASKGQGAVHTKRIKDVVTKAAMIEKKNRFAAVRQLKSAVLMLTQLQCESCVPQRRAADDPPVFVFLGGGMAAGKTTAVTWLSRSNWWKTHGKDAVIVDADAFKLADPLFGSSANDIHKRSTDSAELLLVSAVNQGRDVIFDGTMAWEPFVRQTVGLVRRAHKFVHKRGPGYDAQIHSKPGAPEEVYWEVDGPQKDLTRLPYRIRLIGVTVDPKVGVLRAILRQLTSGRSVPVGAQLRSYRFFSTHFESYANLCDDVILFNNNIHIDLEGGQSPIPCAQKRGLDKELDILDQDAWQQFLNQQSLDDGATKAGELYPEIFSSPDVAA